MVCKVGMSFYCIQILHAKLGSFGGEKTKTRKTKKTGFFPPLVAFADFLKGGTFSVKQNTEGKWGGGTFASY